MGQVDPPRNVSDTTVFPSSYPLSSLLSQTVSGNWHFQRPWVWNRKGPPCNTEVLPLCVPPFRLLLALPRHWKQKVQAQGLRFTSSFFHYLRISLHLKCILYWSLTMTLDLNCFFFETEYSVSGMDGSQWDGLGSRMVRLTIPIALPQGDLCLQDKSQHIDSDPSPSVALLLNPLERRAWCGNTWHENEAHDQGSTGMVSIREATFCRKSSENHSTDCRVFSW